VSNGAEKTGDFVELNGIEPSASFSASRSASLLRGAPVAKGFRHAVKGAARLMTRSS
jgi:hypothetical protein